MLFNSYVFIFCFLPVALIGFEVAGRVHPRGVVLWLSFMSLVFYGYWFPPFLFVLTASIAWNFIASQFISGRIRIPIRSFTVLWIAIAGDLLALCYFKYLFPLFAFIAAHLHLQHQWSNVALPLGISFFTFTQIAFLVDLQQGAAKHDGFLSYLLFVTFFPHLIAGPILHHKDMMPQFRRAEGYRLHLEDVLVGGSWFVMGLIKKVLVADRLALVANPLFDASGYFTPGLAWRGALAYALQLYFDFSGYSDMAVGLARMFSIDFPINFNSPFKSDSIIEFWTRWHMTLSQYINAYLYSPIQFALAKRRTAKGLPTTRKALRTPSGFLAMVVTPTLATMAIAGIWHGAAIPFLLYGVIHGLYLCVNHGYVRLYKKKVVAGSEPDAASARARVIHAAWVGFTFFWVVLALVMFRARDTHVALRIYSSMLSWRHGQAPTPLATPSAGDPATLAVVFLALAVAWFLPNTQELLRNFKPSLSAADVLASGRGYRLAWSPSALWAAALSLGFVFVLIHLQQSSTFLYFQF